MTRFALPLVLSLAGCAGLFPLAGPHAPGTAASTQGPEGRHVSEGGHVYRVGPYWGADCDRIGADKREVHRNQVEAEATMGKQPNLAHDPADQILRLVCVERILSSTSEPARNTWVTQHFRFDELAFDHVTAAMMLVQCLEAESCLGEGAPHHVQHSQNPVAEKMLAAQAARGRSVAQDYEVGMMRWYADRVDAAEVARRIAAWPLPAAAQQAFLGLLDRAKTRVIEVSDELSPEAKHLFVELPAEVFAARAAIHGAHPDMLAQLAALTARVKTERAAGTTGVTDETLAQLRVLRRAYHDSCKADCTRDPVFAAITRQLFWAFVSRGDSPGAMAESKLLAHLEPSAAMEIATKQGAAVDAAIGRTARVSSARRQGIDADSARSTAHGSVVDFGDGRYVYRWTSDFAIDWTALVPDGHEVGQFGGKVAGLEPRGATVVVRFADEVSTWQEGTNCYETNRIDGIGDDGRLIYRQACAGSANHVERHKVAPVRVPADEAAGLHGGDELVGFARGTGDARLGRIWIVKHGARVIRLRDLAI